jgi:hypothetical protein
VKCHVDDTTTEYNNWYKVRSSDPRAKLVFIYENYLILESSSSFSFSFVFLLSAVEVLLRCEEAQIASKGTMGILIISSAAYCRTMLPIKLGPAAVSKAVTYLTWHSALSIISSIWLSNLAIRHSDSVSAGTSYWL